MPRNNYTTDHARRLGFRSGFEAAVARELAGLIGVTYWYEEDYCKFLYSTKVRNGYCGVCYESPVYQEHIYTCDFLVKHGPSDKSFWIETKGRFTSSDRTKMAEVVKANPDADIRLLFQSNQKIRKGSKTTYLDWAEKKGIKAAVIDKKNKRYIPREWLEELGVTDK